MRKNEKITALYERLSRDDFGKDDDQQRESNSISNQKAMLEEFAARQGFTNIVHFTDDGISGTCFDRPGFLAMMKEVEAGNVEYPHSAAYASEHGEMAQYNLSYQANSACKEAIEQTISAHYAENRLDTEAAVKDVLEKFGTERVQFILANTIQRKNYDGRISQDNKAWAKTIPTLEDSGASRHCAYLVVDQVNPGLTDLFTRQFRKVAQEQQKSSVLQKLKQELPAHKSAAPKKREPER